MRLQLMVEAPSQSMEKACSIDTMAVAVAVATAGQLGRSAVSLARHGSIRAVDHQLLMLLMLLLLQLTVTGKQGEPALCLMWRALAVEVRVFRTPSAAESTLSISCAIQRP